MADNIWILAQRDHDAGMSVEAIAKKYDLKRDTVQKRKQRVWDKGICEEDRTSRTKDKSKRTQDKKGVSALSPAEKAHKAVCEAVEANTELSDAHKDFCVHYVKNLNAPAAYIRVYGGTLRNAYSRSHDLLKSVKIQSEIARLRAIKNTILGFGEHDLVEMHLRIAFADITDYVEFENKEIPLIANGNIVYEECEDTGKRTALKKAINELRLKHSDSVDGTLIASITEGREGVNVKLADRHKSLEFLAKYFGAFDKEGDADTATLETKFTKFVEAILEPKERHKAEQGE